MIKHLLLLLDDNLFLFDELQRVRGGGCGTADRRPGRNRTLVAAGQRPSRAQPLRRRTSRLLGKNSKTPAVQSYSLLINLFAADRLLCIK